MNWNLEALGGWFGMCSCVCWCECGYGHMVETDGNAQISWFAAVCFVGVVYVTRQWPWGKIDTLLDVCVSSLRRGHANLLCIVPILTDDPRRESNGLAFANTMDMDWLDLCE